MVPQNNFYLIDVSLLNACILSNLKNTRKMSLLAFEEIVIESFIKSSCIDYTNKDASEDFYLLQLIPCNENKKKTTNIS